ncbi:preprotein translocase subunit SecE [bacterium]|nr:preprotein translocase subunit SecE [bacterium]NUN46170.1 preprotein translocase subunit SecE [bacterium]HMW34336.1 preprotein translocase subunit SecE [bacterium]HMY37556.1 preprotein translocase subunit SecE [bacterium]HMZ05735.1 preprotein translocase subunit SecE [bacterium]
MNRIKEFFMSVQTEMKKVSWPTREELMGSTGVVMVLWLILSLYIFTSDNVLQAIVKKLLL